MNSKEKTKFNEGYRAFLADADFNNCPYVVGSTDYVEWTDGWWEAQFTACHGYAAGIGYAYD